MQEADGPEHVPRYLMLETIHEFAAGVLQESAGADSLNELHAGFFMALVEHAETVLVLAALVNGAGLEIGNQIWVHTMQEIVPGDMLGRVSSVDMLGSFALLPVGFGLTCWAVDMIGAAPVFVLGGALAALFPVLGLTQGWEEGKGMTLEQAIELALRPLPQPASTPAISGTTEVQARVQGPPVEGAIPSAVFESVYPDGLTTRELEVLRLIAAGLNNSQMAEQLHVSPFTVQAHVRSIYSKIGVTTRNAAARYAFDRKLV